MFVGFFERLKKFATAEEEQMELPAEQEGPSERVTVRVESLQGVNDVDRIEKLLKDGNILFVKVMDLQRKDLGQFKQTVQMLKRRCIQFGWDIVGIEEGYMILAPKFAKIARS
jgi:SepF-like predicted cell division protein (DUF552 family)